MKEAVGGDDRFGVEDRLRNAGEGANRGEGGEGTVLGVSAAPLGGIDVGGSGRWPGVSAGMVEELVNGGQSGAAPGKDGQEEECMEAAPKGPAHGKSLPTCAGLCPLRDPHWVAIQCALRPTALPAHRRSGPLGRRVLVRRRTSERRRASSRLSRLRPGSRPA
jgi:hypothetical protein